MIELEGLKRERQSESLVLDGFIQSVKDRQEVLEEFGDRIWIATIDKVVVQKDGQLIFGFKDGAALLK